MIALSYFCLKRSAINLTSSRLIFVITDSVTNSVFNSQVIQPLLALKKKNPTLTIQLITFEKKKITSSCEIPNTISVTQFRSYPFFGTWSLYWSINQLHQHLKIMKDFSLMARGPIAGFIANQAAQKTDCKELIIQARGLLAEEYDYAHRDCSIFTKPIHSLRKKLFNHLEQSVYQSTRQKPFPTSIEAVSPALKEYLIEQFDANPSHITIAKHDVPKFIDTTIKHEWRQTIRTQLHIADDTFVYVYNGSAKPWQCPDDIINFFEEMITKNAHALLLILSQDDAIFKKTLMASTIPESHYRIINVPHHLIYQYLAAADAGLLFRKAHIINWISRPTKALEYQAVQLPIIHNNTVSYLHNPEA